MSIGTIDGYVELGNGDLVTDDCILVAFDMEGAAISRRPVIADEIGLFVSAEDDPLTAFYRPKPETLSLTLPSGTKPPEGVTDYNTGAKRSNAAGRGRFDLIPYEPMLALAKRYEEGAVHYGDRNWEKGQPLSRLLSSLRRHAHQLGHDFSEDHAAAALWNAAAFVTMVERIRSGQLPTELDDIGFLKNHE